MTCYHCQENLYRAQEIWGNLGLHELFNVLQKSDLGRHAEIVPKLMASKNIPRSSCKLQGAQGGAETSKICMPL